MMAFLLSDAADSIYKFQGLLEIRKSEVAVEMVFLDNIPLRSLLMERFQFGPFQWRNSSTARDALFVSKLFWHRITNLLRRSLL